jgi:uncharacterized DUF497 family protein
MKIEFDSTKDEVNREKNGIVLAFGAQLFGDPALLILPTVRREDEEDRYKAVGMVEGKLYTAVHVWRGDAIRFISVRRSNESEEKAYHRD